MSVAVALALTGSVGALSAGADPSTDNPSKVSDPTTYHAFPGAEQDAGYLHKTHNPGRIWTDKTVFDDEDEIQKEPGFSSRDVTLADNEFLVGLSALGTTRQVTTSRQPVIDLVIVIDNSYSMTQCVDESTFCNTADTYTGSRAYAMVEGVNDAIAYITAADKNARIAIQSFGTTTSTMWPLAKPQTVGDTGDYLALTAPSGSNGMTIRTAQTGSSVAVGGPDTQRTNIQRGVRAGMRLLADQTTEGVAGQVQHIPSVILFSDGEPTYSDSNASWWSTTGTTNQGSGQTGASSRSGNGFLAALTAAYWKNRVTDVYNDDVYNTEHGFDPVETNIYTIGFGVDALTPDSAKELALATLDPRGEVVEPTHAQESITTVARDFLTAMTTYVAPGNPRVTVNGTSTYTVTHPDDELVTGIDADTYDLTSLDDLAYNTTFDHPETEAQLVAVFQRIAKDVVADPTVLPTQTTTGLDANADGYVTFTDVLGDYMQFTTLDRVVFCSALTSGTPGSSCTPKAFTASTSTKDADGSTTYSFTGGTYQANDIFPATDVSKILISVTPGATSADGDTVTVAIPVALLPMHNTYVVEDPNLAPSSMTWYDSHPVHVFYQVAPTQEAVDALADFAALETADSAFRDYVANNTVDGKVSFYSNAFTESSDGARTANTVVTFEPSTKNNFYRFAADTTLFSGPDETQKLTEDGWAALSASGVVYRPTVVYTEDTSGAVERDVMWLPLTKAQLQAGAHGSVAVHADADGVMIAPAGLYDMSARTKNLDVAKCGSDLSWTDSVPSCLARAVGNVTDTDPSARATTIDPSKTQSVSTRLGNNGRLLYAVPQLTPDPSWTLTKSSDPASGSSVNPGQTVTYTLTATNDWVNPMSGAQAVDDLSGVLEHATLGALPDGSGLTFDEATKTLTWAVPTMDPGERVTVSYTVTIASDVEAGVTIRNVVTGGGDVPPPDPCPTDDPTCRETEHHTPSWTLTKGSDPASGSTVLPGSTIRYTLTVTNASDVADLSGAVAEDDLSDVLSHASLGKLPAGVTRDGTTLRWAVPDLEPGGEATVSYSVKVDADATGVTIRNVVTGGGDVPPPAPCPTSDPQCRETQHHTPRWTLEKSSDPASGTAVRPGDTVTYTLSATNTGRVPLVGATATDDLSDVVDAATPGTLAAGLTAAKDGKSLTWTIPDLEPGATATVSYSVTVDDGTWGDTLRNVVTATGSIPSEPCEDRCSTEHPIPYWTLTKTSDPASGSTVQPGSEIAYTLTVVNDGPTGVNDAVVTDDLSGVLADAALVGELPDGLVLDGETLTWTVPTTKVGASATVTYTVRVNADAWSKQLHNVATPGDGGACANACETDHVTPAPAADPAAADPPARQTTGLALTGAGVVGAAALALGLLVLGVALVGRRQE